jgi:hypothetical protein
MTLTRKQKLKAVKRRLLEKKGGLSYAQLVEIKEAIHEISNSDIIRSKKELIFIGNKIDELIKKDFPKPPEPKEFPKGFEILNLKNVENKLDALIKKKFPEPIKPKEFPKEIKISNLNEIKPPIIRQKKFIFKQQKLIDAIEKIDLKTPDTIFIKNRTKEEYIPIRIVYQRGDKLDFDPSFGGGAGAVGQEVFPAQIDSGTATVVAAGTPVVLSALTLRIVSIIIKANAANTGDILIGGSGGQNYVLAAGEQISFNIPYLNVVFIDATVNGEGVNFLYTY